MARAYKDIYSYVDEYVDEMRGDWKKFFESDVFSQYVRQYVGNLISGVYGSLRSQGAQIAPSLYETEMNKFRVEKIFDPQSPIQTACCASTDKQFIICINGCSPLVNAVESVEEKVEVINGFLVHETGHRLFTDFPLAEMVNVQMGKCGQWQPIPPKSIVAPNGALTPEGWQLQEKLYNNASYRATFAALLQQIQNATEDGYVEAEMVSHYQGSPAQYLGAVNRVLVDQSDSLTDGANEAEPSRLKMVLGQWLLYAKFGSIKLGEKPKEDFDPELIERMERGFEVIDELLDNRDPIARIKGNNELAVILAPFLDEEIQKQEQKQKNQPPQPPQQQQNNNQQGLPMGGQGGSQQGSQNGSQNGQQGNNASGQNGQQNGQQGGGSAGANKAVQKIIKDAAKGANGGMDPQQGGQNVKSTTRSITNPDKPQNSGLRQTISAQGGGRDGQSTAINQGPPDHSAAEHDVEDILQQQGLKEAQVQAERDRKKDLQKEANSIDYSDAGCRPPEIIRAEDVPESNKVAYDRMSGKFVAIAKRLANVVLRSLKAEEDDEPLRWQYSGRKFSAKQYCRDKLKGFTQRRLPSERIKCRVYVLVDESGSVTKELNDAAIVTSIVLEQFCRSMDVPLTIQGYTSSSGNVTIFSYCEEKQIDGMDKYRLTGMSSRGGTPTVAAMTYAIGRLKKMGDNERKLLFVITDGGANDDTLDGEKTRALVEKAKRNNIQVIACGIGSDKESVHREFGDETYLGIDSLESMPERLLDIIRHRLHPNRRG